MNVEDMAVYFHFECADDGSVLEVGYLGSHVVVEDNTYDRMWMF